MENRIFGFPPVWRSDAEVLILGSMPSEESLKQGFYYAHPRNAFWPMMAEIFGEPMPQTRGEKGELLLSHHIALWDTLGSCARSGSLDSSIRSACTNDFSELYINCPGIKHVLFNGAAAYQYYRRYVAKEDPLRTFRRMPSTSPAYTLSYQNKLAIWKQALEEVNIL